MTVTVEERIAAVAKRRAEREATNETARREQMATDLEALDALEEEHGHERVYRVDLSGWQSGRGAATLVAYKLPVTSDAKVKRFLQQANSTNPNAQQRLEASDALAKSCLVYPSEPELFKATLELAPGLLHLLAKEIFERVQGKAQEEGK